MIPTSYCRRLMRDGGILSCQTPVRSAVDGSQDPRYLTTRAVARLTHSNAWFDVWQQSMAQQAWWACGLWPSIDRTWVSIALPSATRPHPSLLLSYT